MKNSRSAFFLIIVDRRVVVTTRTRTRTRTRIGIRDRRYVGIRMYRIVSCVAAFLQAA